LWFEVKLDKPSTKEVTVRYTTADGLAKTAAGDYRSTSGTLTFAPGQTTKYIPVTVYRSSVASGSKAFLMLLSHPTGATVEAAYAMSTLSSAAASVAVTASPEPIVDPLHYFEEGYSHSHEHEDHDDEASIASNAASLKSRVVNAVLREVQTSRSQRDAAAIDLVMRRLEEIFGDDLALI
jgi:hypothetical protein